MIDKKKLTGYELSRQWFDFAFENPDKISGNHCALWFWIIELCNRLGWKEKFGLPTVHSMEALGIKSYNTYKSVLFDLIRWGFIELIEKAKNQYTSNIIALSNFDKAQYKALDKALTKHLTKQNYIDKQENNKTKETNEPFMSDAFSTDYKPINDFDSIAFILWKQCYDNRVQKKITPTILLKAKPEAWTRDIRLMIERDQRTEQEITEVLKWLKTDSFWSDNILSPEKLRGQFERLQLEMRKTPKGKLSPTKDLTNEDYETGLTEV